MTNPYPTKNWQVCLETSRNYYSYDVRAIDIIHAMENALTRIRKACPKTGIHARVCYVVNEHGKVTRNHD